MLFTRTPLRISLGGGGTDLPSYYRLGHSHFLSAAIDKYIFVGVNRSFSNDYFLKYSEIERVSTRAEVRHKIIREVLEELRILPGIEIVSLADIPGGTGLGSSGTFTVGLIHALSAFNRTTKSAADIADLACEIEIERLGEPVGKQDQYIAAFGGLTSFEISASGEVVVESIQLPTDTLRDFENNLLLFFTGFSRSANSILADQNDRSKDLDPVMKQNLDETLRQGYEIKELLQAGRLRDLASCFNEHWVRKKERSPGMSNSEIDDLYLFGIQNGAIGGKLVGAGAGGFLLFYTEDPQRLRDAMRKRSAQEVYFKFDFDGSTVLTRVD